VTAAAASASASAEVATVSMAGMIVLGSMPARLLFVLGVQDGSSGLIAPQQSRVTSRYIVIHQNATFGTMSTDP